jgi:hypothetical protein
MTDSMVERVARAIATSQARRGASYNGNGLRYAMEAMRSPAVRPEPA